MNARAALRLQIDWGADEALQEVPVNRFAMPGESPALAPPEAEAAPPRPEAARNATRQPATLAPVLLAPALLAPVLRARALAAAASTPDALRAALASFDGCPLATTATNLVFADGNPSAGLMLIGESPGPEEDRAGRPFVGPAGVFLDQILASIGLNRTALLVTTLVPWRPPGNRNPTEAEVQTCLPFLLRHVALARPRRLVLLGALPTKAVLGDRAGIRRLRGRWAMVAIPGLEQPVPALPMWHPAYLLRTPAAKREAWADLLLLRRTLDDDITNS